MIKYPHKKNSTNIVKKTTAKRGMSLENDLDASNKYYLIHNKANIHKKPTPIQIVKVDYPRRSAAKIVEAYFKVPSTTDYNGLYRGYYIDFEAKETSYKTKFVFQNIHQHQIKHLESIIEHGGIAFFIIKFTAFDEVFVLSAQNVINAMNTGAKSLSYDIISKQGYLVKAGYQPRLDYLKSVDILINSR